MNDVSVFFFVWTVPLRPLSTFCLRTHKCRFSTFLFTHVCVCVCLSGLGHAKEEQVCRDLPCIARCPSVCPSVPAPCQLRTRRTERQWEPERGGGIETFTTAALTQKKRGHTRYGWELKNWKWKKREKKAREKQSERKLACRPSLSCSVLFSSD